jgi:cellulose biosynthesis protein BcsQ
VKVIATYNLKGGVGKTSAAVNIAALAAAEGHRTLLWDLDPQGAATFLFRIRPKVRGGARKLLRGSTDVTDVLKGTDVEGLDLLPADFSNRNIDLVLDGTKHPTRRLSVVLAPLADDYDLVLLDCAPSISLASESVFDTADALLVPLVPAMLSLRAFDQLLQFLSSDVRRPPEVVAFFSMVDRRKRSHRDIVENLPAAYPAIVSTSIPATALVEQMGARRAPLAHFAPASPAARAYVELWERTKQRVGLPGSPPTP